MVSTRLGLHIILLFEQRKAGPALDFLSVTRILDMMPTFRRFILGTGDATAHATPVANLRAISELVQRYAWK